MTVSRPLPSLTLESEFLMYYVSTKQRQPANSRFDDFFRRSRGKANPDRPISSSRMIHVAILAILIAIASGTV